ncbi:uracil-DNA glycosylase [Patescibacteria group bacterium]|nr:uracil-DNA glycosylase [Patescibacteria group bacterium]
MVVKIENSWKNALKESLDSSAFKELSKFVRDEYLSAIVYPPPKLIFNAFDLCPFRDVKVVVLGQDPYHGPSQAHGLCFSVPDKVSIPPSLQNIYKEIQTDLGLYVPKAGNLENWARQGVLLLNATLTVRAGVAGSHQGKGWERFTDEVIEELSNERENLVFLLWGRYAQDKGSVIDTDKHLVLSAAHPSPFSAHNGFFGCKHFSKTNDYLRERGLTPISWT